MVGLHPNAPAPTVLVTMDRSSVGGALAFEPQVNGLTI